MRRLLLSISLILLTVLLFLLLSGQFSNRHPQIAPAVSELSEEEVEAVEPSPDPIQSPFLGTVIYRKDPLTWTYDYTAYAEDDNSLLNFSGIVLYKDTIPIDTVRVIGTGRYFAEDGILKFAVGIDTVSYSLLKLPEVIDPVKELIPPGTVNHTYKNSFELSDSSWTCTFEYNANLPSFSPAWLKQFISTTILNDLQAMFLDNKGAEKIYKDYMNIPSKPRKIRGLDASGSTPEHIAEHFFTEFKRLYEKEFDSSGPRYDYSFSVWPVWESKDKRYATYRFYTYYYTMGMHGFMEEYYLTFDSITGHILGFNDLFSPKVLPKALSALEKGLTREKNREREEPSQFQPGIQADEISSNAWVITKEKIDSLFYPRPAITEKGVVYSYQPYEMGAFYEGVIHILVPHDEVTLKISL